ncbi:MAG TPA: multidrug effflux MFS transporter [Nakamurella sp.]
MSGAIRRSSVLTLAAIVGLAPFAIDMYLPSLPEIGVDLAAPVWLTQLTLTGYLLVLGIGQLVAGPITDAVGRRRPLILGLAVFTLGSGLAAVAPSMAVLIAARLLQAFGGATALVVANSSVRDSARGDAATRLYAVLLTVGALAPIVAPTAGGFLGSSFGWRSVFVALAVIGVVVTLAAVAFLPESLPATARIRFSGREVMGGYRRTLGSKAFVIPLVTFSLMYMAMFTYIGGATYVYQGTFGMDPAVFGTVFGATGLSLLVGALVANRLSERLGTRRLGLLGILLTIVGASAVTLAILVHLPVWAVVASMALALFGVGVSEPALMSLSMSAVETGTGSAAAVLGAAQYVLGAAATAVVGAVAAISPAGWGLLMAVLALVAFVLLAGSRPRKVRSVAVAVAHEHAGR